MTLDSWKPYITLIVVCAHLQVCTWIGGVCTTVNPYWSLVLWEPKATSRLWFPSSQSHTAPAKTRPRSPSPSVPSKTSRMPLSTHCRSVDVQNVYGAYVIVVRIDALNVELQQLLVGMYLKCLTTLQATHQIVISRVNCKKWNWVIDFISQT